jgi:exopolyphosphatase/guanosine-5'-triphosphate,3'-diphosphate pyrophosphatase
MNELFPGLRSALPPARLTLGPSGMQRLGVIDVGSNSVRMVVFDGVARSPAYFYNEKVLCGLGTGLAQSGHLSPEGSERALVALRRFAALAAHMDLHGLTAVATAAVREAADGPAFCDRVEAETGLSLRIASGREEAQLSAKGVLLGWPEAEGIVCDMGGASMELARIEGGEIGRCETSGLGPLKLRDVKGGPKALERYIRKEARAIASKFPARSERLFLVGGSWRAIARLDMERRAYPLKVLHEYELSPRQVIETAEWVRGRTPEELAAFTDTSMARLSLVPIAARVLEAVTRELRPKRIAISAYGIREGLLYELMPSVLRAQDPLIAACRHMEANAARFPGFGEALYDWLDPLYAQSTAAEDRLRRAACLLHDTTWRAHPDYRAEICFESVTRANLGGIDHASRVMLGLALMARYKSGSDRGSHDAHLGILSFRQRAWAETLGAAMRLGAMLTGAVAESLQDTAIRRQRGEVVLSLAGRARGLMGEVVEKRLATLAQLLGAKPRIEMKGEGPETNRPARGGPELVSPQT